MAANMHEEDQLGKAFDLKIMRRLLSYVKPYSGLVLMSVLMTLVATVAALARPYLIEIAIDRHMTALTKPMVVYAAGQAPHGVTVVDWANKQYVREALLSSSDRSTAQILPEAELLHDNGQWFLVSGTASDLPLPDHSTVQRSSQQPTVSGKSGHSLPAIAMSQSTIDTFQKQDAQGIIVLGLWYLGALAIAFVLNFFQTYMIGYIVQKIVNDLRLQLFTRLQKLNLSFFDKNPVGRLVTRVMNDCQTINDMFANVLLSFFQDIFTILGIIVVLLNMNLSLAFVSFVAVPLIIIASAIYRHYARDAFRNVRVKLARINASLAENISGMRIIHMFHRQNQVYKRFHATNDDYLKSSMRELLTFAVFRPSMDFIYYLIFALVLWYGGLHVLNGAIQFGVLYAFTNYVQQFFQPINDLSEKYNLVQQAMASSERVFELLDSSDQLVELEQPTVPAQTLGKVEFRNVWFAYIGEEWVLKDLSFVIHPGQTVAFVGATGAGKSSILSLMSRFYDIQKGSILVDDVDVKDWPLDELRKRIGVVLQDVFLFSGTIEENIRLGQTSITRERVNEVIRYVNAEPFVSRLPDGILHQVQERGSTFSAGERQLIAFARALAFNPEVLVLDEATANIDTETEQWIQDALVKITQDRTTIVVAHRLSTIQHADNIIVLHKGRLRESGTHQDLLSQRGLYWNLYQLQYQDQELAAQS